MRRRTLAGALAFMPTVSAAQNGPCTARSADFLPPAAGAWGAPLDRRVTLRVRDVSLRETLDRLAAAARIRLSYSGELIPLERRVCLDQEDAPLGGALERLLAGTNLEAVPAGGDQIVIRPKRPAADTGAAATDPTFSPHVQALDRVVVTGSAVGRPERELTVSLASVSGAELVRRDVRTVSQLLNGVVPGVWAWEQAPSAFVARYASIRGASSFGVSYPKVYIDGIEVANPLLAAELIPETIERVEIIRGPQGAALYGSDAISGVVNITTRHEGSGDGAIDLRVRSALGVAETEYVPRPPLAQYYTGTLRAGSSVRSLSLAVAGSRIGAFVPGANARHLSAVAAGRLVGSRSIVGATARFAAADAASPLSPVLDGGVASVEGELADESMRQYTVGLTAQLIPSARWRHALVIGADGYRLSGIPDEHAPVPSVADDALRAARGDADRFSLRASSIAQLLESGRASTTLTLAAEHSVLRQVVEEPAAPQPMGPPRNAIGDAGTLDSPIRAASEPAPDMGSEPGAVAAWRRSTGAVAQLNIAFREAFYGTGGLRVERNDGFNASSRLVTLPMLGIAFVGSRRNVTLKARAAFGKGIRAPRSTPRDALWFGARGQVREAALEPEEQRGTEVGLELYAGGALSLQVTRFDQLASGLIQRVAVPGGPGRFTYRLQNVGEITNRGWEMQATVGAGALSLAGSLSLVDSRVRTLAAGYVGDLRPGDRLLEVPSKMAGLTLGYQGARSAVSIGIARASDWINYDRLALYQGATDSDGPGDPRSVDLRSYWRGYAGETRARVAIARRIGGDWELVLTGENLLDRQQGEPDNVTVLPGRTTTVGLRARF